MFQQDNAQLDVADFVWNFIDTENVWMVTCLAHSRDLSLLENIWSMAAE